MSADAPIQAVKASAFTVPTDRPEADGTFAWTETTLVPTEVEAGGETGLGFSDTGAPAADPIAGPLKEAVQGLSAFDPQADATRTGGLTGFLRVAALAGAHQVDLSGHCAPAMHLHAALAAPNLRHLEWFHDHARIEHMLFDGAPVPDRGAIEPDLPRSGHGLVLRSADAEPHRVQ